MAGLIGAALLTRVMSTLLFGVSATDIVTFSAVPVILATIALLASYLPARRATQVGSRAPRRVAPRPGHYG